jgi:IclR family transcriptional regulator, acetate operon repressor
VNHDASSARTPPGLLQTVDRALQLLLTLNRSRRDLGVTEVAEEFGWDKSVAHRILATLAYRGLLVSDPDTRRYRLGPAILALHRAFEASGTLALVSRDVLEGLASSTGLTAVLAVPDIAHVRCVLSVAGPRDHPRYYPLVGELYPAHAGATSKAYFAFLSDDERHRLLDRRPMARFTEKTVPTADQFELQLAQVRADGYAFTTGEYDTGVAVMAVPVMVGGEPVASLSIGGTAEELPEHHQWLPPLRSACEKLVRRLTSPRVRP